MRLLKTIIVITVTFVTGICTPSYAQSPYAIFGDNSRTLEAQKLPVPNIYPVEIRGNDATSYYAEFDFRQGDITIYDMDGNIVRQDSIRKNDKARFTTVDPETEKYPHLSPYNYCGNDPVNCIDPDGEDIVVLNYGNGKHQHLAMLIQDENGKWKYYSVNGNNVYISGKHIGGREFNDIGVGSWDSPNDFIHSQYNMRTDNSKDDKSKNHFGFSEGYQIPTSAKQDAIMRNSFEEKAKTWYTPLGNNCATTVQYVMFEAGIPIASPKYETIHIPANKYLGESEQNIVRPNINPWPSSAFKSIVKLNPNGKYILK